MRGVAFLFLAILLTLQLRSSRKQRQLSWIGASSAPHGIIDVAGDHHSYGALGDDDENSKKGVHEAAPCNVNETLDV